MSRAWPARVPPGQAEGLDRSSPFGADGATLKLLHVPGHGTPTRWNGRRSALPPPPVPTFEGQWGRQPPQALVHCVAAAIAVRGTPLLGADLLRPPATRTRGRPHLVPTEEKTDAPWKSSSPTLARRPAAPLQRRH